LVVYWRQGAIVFENYFTGHRITAKPEAVVLLNCFENWRTLSEVQTEFKNYKPASLAKSVRELVQRHLLVQEGSAESRMDRRLEKTWSTWLPSAGMLQFGTRNARYDSNLRGVWRRFQERARANPLPSPVKHYPKSAQIRLPEPQKTGIFPETLLARRTWRRFSKNPIRLSDLATLLGLTWGIQRWLEIPKVGRLAFKTSPSAGARHPIEAYVLAVNVDGLPRGLYHYAADRHSLELLKLRARPKDLVRLLGNQWWYAPASALFLMTAVFSRNHWKYQHPAAYRTVMIDAGHICQTLCLVATWLGLAPFCTMALDQVVVEKELGIDGIEESIVYAAGVGTLPRGTNWAPWPRPAHWNAIAHT
jgi:SagB-type dehydrogenase family enzyme